MEQNRAKISSLKNYWRCQVCGRINLDVRQCPCGALPEIAKTPAPVDGKPGLLNENCKIREKRK